MLFLPYSFSRASRKEKLLKTGSSSGWLGEKKTKLYFCRAFCVHFGSFAWACRKSLFLAFGTSLLSVSINIHFRVALTISFVCFHFDQTLILAIKHALVRSFSFEKLFCTFMLWIVCFLFIKTHILVFVPFQ